MNTGHIMDDETFITHLLNSLSQTEYEGAILVIKDKLRKGPVEIPEIDDLLELQYHHGITNKYGVSTVHSYLIWITCFHHLIQFFPGSSCCVI